MTVRGFTTSLAVLACALAVAGAAPGASPVPGEKLAFDAVKHAPIAGSEKAIARAEIERAVHLIRTLPSGRREHVAVALEELAAFDHRLTLPRTLALVGQLKANDDYFSQHYAPADKTDIVDDDGLVYRYFAGRCLEFHPLANMGALNARIATGDIDGTRALADALIARGVYQRGGGIGFEYLFGFDGGRAPWLSGMAQAVAAQAFSRAAGLVPERATAYLSEAQSAYRLIPRHLLTEVAAGPWIRLYAFNAVPVLNAQLQAVLSLQSYATAAHDSGAGALAKRMQNAAAAMLPRFDTGYWTYYSLAGDPSPLDYQQFVASLLKKLASDDPRFAAAAVRIGAYTHQPPAFQVANGGLGTLRFWLSKPSTVSVVTAAGPTKRVSMNGGWHTLDWGEPKNVGVFPLQVTATDWAGNRASFQPLPIVRVTASKAGPSRATAAAVPAPPPAFAVGAGVDDPSQAPVAKTLGLRLVRVNVPWPAGATEPDPALVASLQAVTSPLLVDLTVAAPVDALPQYAASLVQQVPGIRGLVLSGADPATFAAVKAAVPTEPLGVPVADRTTARAWSGTALDLVTVPPAASLAQLLAALGQTPEVFVDGLGSVGAAAAITSLACNPSVSGVIVDGLTGAESAVKAAAAPAQRGTVVCPGLAVPATPSTLTFPQTVDVPVTLGCARDCLYLVTLDDAQNRPVVASRGALRGGFPPAHVTLPQAKLKPGAYRVDVRLVNQVNPGPVTQQTGPPLTVP